MATRVSRTVTVQENICGICEQPAATKYWPNHLSHYAHGSCIRWIKAIDDTLWERISHYFPDRTQKIYRNMAHTAVIKKMQNEIGNTSILQFVKDNGRKELEACFPSEKIEAALKECHEALTNPFLVAERYIEPDQLK